MIIRCLFIIGLVGTLWGCWRPAGIGVGGQYLDAKSEIVKGRRGDVKKAVSHLEYVVVRDPTYRDSLTLLGRAYYGSGRYKDAYEILKRALAIHPDDEIAWISLGLTELRMGDDVKGLETMKGAITLFSKVSKEGYKGIEFWDTDGYVRSALRRTAFAITKGLEAKESIIQNGEVLLSRIDEEEWYADRKEHIDRMKPAN